MKVYCGIFFNNTPPPWLGQIKNCEDDSVYEFNEISDEEFNNINWITGMIRPKAIGSDCQFEVMVNGAWVDIDYKGDLFER